MNGGADRPQKRAPPFRGAQSISASYVQIHSTYSAVKNPFLWPTRKREGRSTQPALDLHKYITSNDCSYCRPDPLPPLLPRATQSGPRRQTHHASSGTVDTTIRQTRCPPPPQSCAQAIATTQSPPIATSYMNVAPATQQREEKHLHSIPSRRPGTRVNSWQVGTVYQSPCNVSNPWHIYLTLFFLPYNRTLPPVLALRNSFLFISSFIILIYLAY